MKYIIIVPDGMSDHPSLKLNGKTPLQAAHTPNIDALAKKGIIGKTNNVPAHMEVGSDVANLSLLGYDPALSYAGRAPYEALSLGLQLKPSQIAFRCNLVTIDQNKMQDYSAGHISTQEAKILIEYVNQKLGTDAISFHAGISYKHIMLADCEKLGITFEKLIAVGPHDILDKPIQEHFPYGDGADFLIDLMIRSNKILQNHEINKIRIDLKENPANMIWLWGQGKTPSQEKFKDKFFLEGSLISAVTLLKGIALAIGLENINVPGTTGYYDTDYDAKARYGIEALEKKDFLYLHIESPDEAGHNGHINEKIKAIENIDKKIIGPILKAMQDKYDYRILIAPDHPTPVDIRTHCREDVPFLMYGKGIMNLDQDPITEYSEDVLKNKKALVYEHGYELTADFLLKKEIIKR